MKSFGRSALAVGLFLFQNPAWSFSIQSHGRRCNVLVSARSSKTAAEEVGCGRRDVLGATAIGVSNALLGAPLLVEALSERPTAVLRLESPNDKAGVALYDVTIGTPPRTVAAIQKVISNKTPKLQPGLILKDYPNSQAVVDRIRQGPYPIELEFYNLDSSNGELGEALTAKDALALSQRQSGPEPASAGPPSENTAYVKRTIQQGPNCRLRARRDDVLEIQYTAHIGSLDGIIYDASEFRGTGRPYQMVLGSGDVLPGVDQGLYDMCVSEKRQLEIPPSLAYGAKGNKIYRIPPNSRLVWEVELISISTMRDVQDEAEDME